MKKLNFFAVALFLGGILTQAQTFQNNTATIPVDGVTRTTGCGYVQPGVEMSDILVNTVGVIGNPSKITVSVALTAGWLGDVVVELVCPSGEAITLIRRIGASSNSGCGDSSKFIPANILSFNSDNTAAIDVSAGVGVAVPGGNVKPSYGTAKFPVHHPGNMATFLTGKTLNGTWKLIIYDYGTGEPVTLNSWQMQVATGATLKSSNVAATFGSEISLKQNPVQDYLMVDVTDDFKSLNLEIYDASGKRIKSENLLRNAKNIQLDVRNLSPGMYLLIPVKDGERKQAIKFIKK